MSVSNRTILQSMLTADYDGIVRKLTRKFGSADFARETLHETFARLDGISDKTALQNPKDYLFRIAINVGKNLRRGERVRATAGEIEAFFDIPDETPGPAQTVEARSDMNALLGLLAELPPRTRAVFETVLFHDTPYAQIAADLGVSLRTVERDVQRAIEYCAQVLDGRGFGHMRTRGPDGSAGHS